MAKATCAHTSRHMTFFLLSIVILGSFLGASVQSSAQALQCGATVSSNTTLSANLGPCPNNGLSIEATTAPVTINLNGYRIIGSGSASGGTGISVYGARSGVTIEGPGGITNFGLGITIAECASESVPVIVSKLILTGNQYGINVSHCSGFGIQVLDNALIGGAQGLDGIVFDDSGVYIHRNTIAGYSIGINILGETSTIIDGNVLALNQAGIVETTASISCAEIRKNLVTLNSGNGIQVFAFNGEVKRGAPAVTPPACVTIPIENNVVSWNGGSGIVVEGGEGYGVQVEKNILLHNAANGIAVNGAQTEGAIEVTSNRALNNGTDLFWNGVGTNICWSSNTFGTSVPSTLPQCQ